MHPEPSFNFKKQKTTEKNFLVGNISCSKQGRIKDLVGPRHFCYLRSKTNFIRPFYYIKCFVGPIFTLRRPLFTRRPQAVCLVCLMDNPAMAQRKTFYLKKHIINSGLRVFPERIFLEWRFPERVFLESCHLPNSLNMNIPWLFLFPWLFPECNNIHNWDYEKDIN